MSALGFDGAAISKRIREREAADTALDGLCAKEREEPSAKK